jgi:hypothetical protein
MAYRRGNCNNTHGVSTGIRSDDAVARNWASALVLAEARSVQAQTIACWQLWKTDDAQTAPTGGDL